MEIDGGPQTPATQRDREIVAATLSRAQRDARSLNDELTRTLTRAQNAKVPDELDQSSQKHSERCERKRHLDPGAAAR